MKILTNGTDTGSKSVLVPLPNYRSVSILVLFKAGSRLDIESYSGTAHLLEHLVFKGSKEYPTSKAISYAIELLGGHVNAFTSYEYTGYYIKVPAGKFKEAFEILQDMVCHPIVNEAELEKEKEVVIQEIGMYDDSPQSIVDQNFTEQLFQNSSLGLQITGTKESVLNITQSELLGFVRNNYNRGNALVSIAGNFDESQAKDLISGYFDNLPAQTPSADSAQIKQLTLKGRITSKVKDTNQAHIVMGGYAYPKKDERRYIYQVARAYLAYGFGSIMYKELRDKLALTYYLHFDTSSYNEIGSYSIHLGVDPAKIQFALDQVVSILKNIKHDKISTEGFLRATRYLEGSIITHFESSAEIASYFGLEYLLRDSCVDPDTSIALLSNVSSDEILSIYQELFIEANLIAHILGPKDNQYTLGSV